jgi:hypothetical protein
MTMNPTPDHLDDEILSALLDGDSAAGSLDAAAHLGGCDRCAGRQAELAAARAALAAAPVEPLDELTRRRLVAAALQGADETPAALVPAARSRWAQRHPAFIGSAAAVLLAVLVGVPFVVGRDGGSQGDKTLAAQAPNAREESASPFLGDLGDLSDHDRLRLRLSGGRDESFAYAPAEPGPSPAAGAGATAAPVAPGAPTAGGLAGSSDSARTAAPPSTLSATAGAAKSAPVASGAEAATATDAAADQSASRDRADTDACVTALLNGAAQGGRLTGSGTGTFRGRPAIVAAFERSGGTVAFVVDRAGCAVLEQFSV